MTLLRWGAWAALGLETIGAATGCFLAATATVSSSGDYLTLDGGDGGEEGGGDGGGDSSSVTLTIGDFPGCTEDSSLDCSGGSLGISCPSGNTPGQGNYVCSQAVTSAGGMGGYCCIYYTGTCLPDSTVSCPDPLAYGFTCQTGDSPWDGDPTLYCSAPGGNGAQFCCLEVGNGSSNGADGG